MSNSEMNTATVLSTTEPEGERMDSVSMTDIEAQNQTINEETIKNLKAPLKGILKKPEITISSDGDAASLMAMKICGSACILIIMVPIIVADLYFGFTDRSCVNDEPKNLAISMKLYLLVSGFTGMGAMISLITGICCLTNDEESALINLCCTTCIIYVVGIFNIIWNILGAVVFWGTIYGEDNCNKNISTYIYVSLIIKLVAVVSSLLQKKQEKKK